MDKIWYQYMENGNFVQLSRVSGNKNYCFPWSLSKLLIELKNAWRGYLKITLLLFSTLFTKSSNAAHVEPTIKLQLSPLILASYICRLFPRCKHEIFILGMLGFLKTTQSFLKIPEKKSKVIRRSLKLSEEVWSRPKKSKVFRRCLKSAEGEVNEKTLLHKDQR